jgi:hypothetical protein
MDLIRMKPVCNLNYQQGEDFRQAADSPSPASYPEWYALVDQAKQRFEASGSVSDWPLHRLSEVFRKSLSLGRGEVRGRKGEKRSLPVEVVCELPTGNASLDKTALKMWWVVAKKLEKARGATALQVVCRTGV